MGFCKHKRGTATLMRWTWQYDCDGMAYSNIADDDCAAASVDELPFRVRMDMRDLPARRRRRTCIRPFCMAAVELPCAIAASRAGTLTHLAWPTSENFEALSLEVSQGY